MGDLLTLHFFLTEFRREGIIRKIPKRGVPSLTLLLILVLLLIGGLAAYYYRFLRRLFLAFGAEVSRWRIRIAIAALTLLLLGSCYFVPPMLLVLLHLLLFNELCRLLHFLYKKCAKKESKFLPALHRSGAVPLLLTLAILLFGYFNMHNVVQTDYTLRTHKAIRFDGYRVALLSDIHYGVSLDQAQLQALCREVSAQQPDLVILCGDLVDNTTSYAQMAELFCALGEIQSSYGSYYVYGNHDRPFYGLASAFDDADLRTHMEAAGITVLQDEVLPLTSDLTLIGREDRSRERASLSSLLQQADGETYLLTLDHQPCEYAENAAAGTDLLLSGHTHGGQIWPANLLDRLVHFNDANYGLTSLGEQGHAIVTSGVAGWGWPIKTSAPSEYVIIRILPG